jgi:hypothetical protein
MPRPAQTAQFCDHDRRPCLVRFRQGGGRGFGAPANSHALRDDLLALAGLSVMGRGQTWAEGRLRLSPEALRRATTPLDWRPQLPGVESYEGRRLPK